MSLSDVRYLLKCLQDPSRLAHSQIAIRLQRLFALDKPKDAVLAAIDNAFTLAGKAGDDASELRDLIWENGVETESSVERARGGLSQRTYFRKRALAVQTIAGYLCGILSDDQSSEDLLKPFRESQWQADPMKALPSRGVEISETSAQTVVNNLRSRVLIALEIPRNDGSLSHSDLGKALAIQAVAAHWRGNLSAAEDFLSRAHSYQRDATGRKDVETIFEMARAGFLVGKCYGDAPAMAESLQQLRGWTHKLPDRLRIEAELLRAESQLYSADTMGASQILRDITAALNQEHSHRLCLLALLAKARIEFTTGNVRAAHSLAQVVESAAEGHRDVRVGANALNGRIAALSRQPWEPALNDAPTKWHELVLGSIAARHYLAVGRYDDAYGSADVAYRESMLYQFHAVAARAAATLAGCYAAAEPDRRNAWLLEALRLASIITANSYVLRDVFGAFEGVNADLGPLTLGEKQLAELARIYLRSFPESAFHRNNDTFADLCSLLRIALDLAKARESASAGVGSIREIAERLDRADVSGAMFSAEIRLLVTFGGTLRLLLRTDQQSLFERSYRSAVTAMSRLLLRFMSVTNMRNTPLFAS